MTTERKAIGQKAMVGHSIAQETGIKTCSEDDRPREKSKVFLRTFGCQMNIRDSEVICGLLRNAGYKLAADSESADIVILNTCSVRQHAEDKVWSAVGLVSKRYPLNAKRYTRPIIGIVGCMAQNYKDDIFRRAPQVDFAVGPSDIAKIPGIIKRFFTNDERRTTNDFLERKIWETGGGLRPEEVYHSGFYQDKEHAYVIISEGCSNFCSYCVVPYVRGPLRNRKPDDILEEIKEAVEKGISRITLLGQNVNAYQFRVQGSGFRVDFIELLRQVNATKGLKEFSFITSHPKDTSIELFKVMADCAKLKKYLHLPVQSGSDRVLKAMRRGYTRKDYLGLAKDYRKIVKGAVLTTDIIVGFPQEREEDFQDTYDLLKEVRFDAAYIFKYSPRPHSKAADLADDVAKKEKERRHALILELQKKISKKVKKTHQK